MATYSGAPNQQVAAANRISSAYRLDKRDLALIDALASRRRVVTFDNVAVGATTGTTPRLHRADGP
jgi:hypothetical protein